MAWQYDDFSLSIEPSPDLSSCNPLDENERRSEAIGTENQPLEWNTFR